MNHILKKDGLWFECSCKFSAQPYQDQFSGGTKDCPFRKNYLESKRFLDKMDMRVKFNQSTTKGASNVTRRSKENGSNRRRSRQEYARD